MDTCHQSAAGSPCSELIWETDGQGTAQAGDVSFAAGDRAAWTPEQLLGVAAAASLMSAFFELARRAGLSVLAYASQQHLERIEGKPRPELVISPCITVRSDEDAVLARALCDHAFAESTIVAALACPIHVEPHVVALPAERVDCEC